MITIKTYTIITDKWLYTNVYIYIYINDYIQMTIYKWLYTNDYNQMDIYIWLYTIDYICKWLYTNDYIRYKSVYTIDDNNDVGDNNVYIQMTI